MRETTRNGKKYLVVDGSNFEYDGSVKIYIDSATGNWVIDTNLEAEAVLEVLDSAGEHFVDQIATQDLSKTVILYPLKDTGYH